MLFSEHFFDDFQAAFFSASQMRVALSNSARNTDSRSPGDELMTWSTCDVAVCCSSDCFSSLSSRTFSMAITAWAAKFRTSSIC